MATQGKALENMAKHLTQEEIEAREAAEAAVMPVRVAKLKAPGYVTRDKVAKRYWSAVMKRMEGISLLDDLDTEVLGIYCSMLARRDEMQGLCATLMALANDPEGDSESQIAASEQLGGVLSRLGTMEGRILQYAEKLGLTPAGRVRLARKRAESVNAEPDDDLFGD